MIGDHGWSFGMFCQQALSRHETLSPTRPRVAVSGPFCAAGSELLYGRSGAVADTITANGKTTFGASPAARTPRGARCRGRLGGLRTDAAADGASSSRPASALRSLHAARPRAATRPCLPSAHSCPVAGLPQRTAANMAFARMRAPPVIFRLQGMPFPAVATPRNRIVN